MAVLGIASVSPALPSIASALKIGDDQIGLIISAFALPGLLMTPILGILADKFGRKTVLVPALFLFGIAGFLCFYAESFNTLIVYRFLQGTGAASLGALNVTLIGDIFDTELRPKIIGFNHGVLSIGTTLFPIIGGALSSIHYNYVFLMPLIAIPVGLYVLLFLDKNVKSEGKSISKYHASIMKALKDIRLLKLFIISVATFIILMGAFLTYIPLYTKFRFNLDPMKIGILLASMSATTSISAFFLGKMIKRVGHKKLLMSGFIFYSISFISVLYYSNWKQLIISSIIFGLGHSFVLPNTQSLIIKFTKDINRSFIMSFNRMISQVGQFLGPIIFGLIYSSLAIKLDSYILIFSSAAAICLLILTIIPSIFKNLQEE